MTSARSLPLSRAALPLAPPAVAFLVVAVLLGGPAEAAVAFGAFVLPALPGVAIYRMLRPGAGGLEAATAGLAIGIPLSTVVFVCLDVAGFRNPAFVVVPLGVAGAVALLAQARRTGPSDRPAGLPRPTRLGKIDSRMWIGATLLCALAAAMYLPPALSAAAPLPDGSRGFVRNFGFDFLRHLTFTAATIRGPLPPSNYFVEGARADAYWLYYPGPALMGRALSGHAELHRALLSYNFLLLCVFLGHLAARLRRTWASTIAAIAGAAVFWAASSWRGIASRTPVIGPAILGEERFVFTVPLYFSLFMGHHLLALLLVTVLLAIYRPGGGRAGRAGAFATGLLLPVTGLISPFIGAVAALWFAGFTAWSLAARRTRRLRVLFDAGLSLVPGLVGLGAYAVVFGTKFNPAKLKGINVSFDFDLRTLPLNLLMCMGPLLALAALGWTRRRLRAPASVSVLALAVSALLVTLFLVVEGIGIEATYHEVQTKAGMALMMALAFPAAAGVSRLLSGRIHRRAAAVAVAATVLVGGIVNSGAYVYAYSDLDSARTIRAEDWRAALWMRDNLPPGAGVIVSHSTRYGPKNYSFVPPFAHVQVERGTKGVFARYPTYNELERRLYEGDTEVLEQYARDKPGWYLYCGGAEHALNPEVIEDLDRHPDLLEVVYEDGPVRIYRFRRERAGRSSGPVPVPGLAGVAAQATGGWEGPR